MASTVQLNAASSGCRDDAVSGPMPDTGSFRRRQNRCGSNAHSPVVAQGIELKHSLLDQPPHLLAIPVFSQQRAAAALIDIWGVVAISLLMLNVLPNTISA